MLSEQKIQQARVIADRHPGISRDRFLIKMLGDSGKTVNNSKGTSFRLTVEASNLLADLQAQQIIRIEEPSALRGDFAVYPFAYIKPRSRPHTPKGDGLKVYSPGDPDYPGIPQPKNLSSLKPIEQTMEPSEVAQAEAFQEKKSAVLVKVLDAIAKAEAEAEADGSYVMPSKIAIARMANVGKAYLSQKGADPGFALAEYQAARKRLAEKNAARANRRVPENPLVAATKPTPVKPVEAAIPPDVAVVVQLEERIHHLQEILSQASATAECRGLALEQAEAEADRLRKENKELEEAIAGLKSQLKALGDRVAQLQEHRQDDSLIEALRRRIALEERTVSNCTREIDQITQRLDEVQQDKGIALKNLDNWRQLLSDLEGSQTDWNRNGHCRVAA